MVCPEDSEQILQIGEYIISSYQSDYDPHTNTYRTNNSNSENNDNQYDEFDIDESNNNNQNKQNNQNNSNNNDNSLKTLNKRSVSYERRESIKIVPGGYIRKRRNTHTNNHHRRHHIIKNDELIEKCCDIYKCRCKLDACPLPECPWPLVVKLLPQLNEEFGMPGNCCRRYACIRPTFCVVEEIQQEKKRYKNGEKWLKDPCTECECDNGEPKCFISQCYMPTCLKLITLEGNCCPTCDNTGSDFCQGSENCDKVCKHGYKKSDHNDCDLCVCAKSNRNSTRYNITSTTTFPPIPAKPTVTTTGTIKITSRDNSVEFEAKPANDTDNLPYKITLVICAFIVFTIFALIGVYVWRFLRVQDSYRTVPSLDSNLNRIENITTN